ncbi:cytochrome c oxidase assembly protein [Notoacmeibacter ruber]|uniref:Cytochrome-c oxidase n=1 Tax=Notoacmeibacter ruber TaxID=2670375 RepID=A0A3L7JDP1_9HYPH|nr:cytochrome c oxidase assembly protein [Notoacmeibacter ruber]RLQ88425.1 cytochrome-c oxidase [Notoacmeibacter ruber]
MSGRRGRVTCLTIALLLLCLVWAAPLLMPSAGRWPFTLHMVRHMVLVAVAAPLLVLALPRLSGGLILSPLIAAVLEFFVVWGWHFGTPHQLAQTSWPWFVLEQASFLVVGYGVWASSLNAASGLAGAGGLLLTSMHMTLLGALLTLAPRPLYAAICYGTEPLADQQLGGMLMLAVGGVAYLVGGVALVRRSLGGSEDAVPMTGDIS